MVAFSPREAMLARVLAMALCLSVSVCLSVCHKSEFYRKGWTNRAGFGVGASFRPSYTVLKGNSGISKIRALPSGTVSQTVDLEKIFLRYIDRRNVLSILLDERLECDKLDRRRLTKLTIPPSSDARPLVYRSNHRALSTAQFRRAGQLATADTFRSCKV